MWTSNEEFFVLFVKGILVSDKFSQVLRKEFICKKKKEKRNDPTQTKSIFKKQNKFASCAFIWQKKKKLVRTQLT